VFDVDKGSKDLGSFRFNNIVLVRHGGIDGSGDSKMIKAFSPGSPLISMLSPLMTNGGSLWLNQCFAGSFVAKTPGYLTAISQSFGGANVYYGTGMQATFNFGLASRVATRADSYIANRYLNYQVYKPGP
jgi:hypothetical protein